MQVGTEPTSGEEPIDLAANEGFLGVLFKRRGRSDDEDEEAWEGIRYPETFSKAWDLHFENCREWCHLGKLSHTVGVLRTF